jgi:hypothetical protein
VPDPDLSARPAPFTPGDRVAIMEILGGRTWTYRPVTVVQDNAHEVVLWLAPGTITRYPTGLHHRSDTFQKWLDLDWELGDKPWGPPGVLRISQPGRPYDVWTFPTDGNLSPWYVNLQDPLTRVDAGFVTMDHILDIVIAPDLTSWSWKDEAELEQAQDVGFYTAEQAATIRETGNQIIKTVEAGHPPWNTHWQHWTPPVGRGQWRESAHSRQ